MKYNHKLLYMQFIIIILLWNLITTKHRLTVTKHRLTTTKHTLRHRLKVKEEKDMTIPKSYTELETKYGVEVVDSEINQGEFTQIFSKRKMTRGEIKYVFDTMDYGKNDRIG